MNVQVVLSGLVACATLCAIAPTVCAKPKIFPKVYVTTSGSGATAAASPFGGKGTVDESDQFGQPETLVHGLAMPVDIAVTDDIVYAVIGNKGLISAFSASNTQDLLNSNVATVPKGKPVGIAAFGGNVFVADSHISTIKEYTV